MTRRFERHFAPDDRDWIAAVPTTTRQRRLWPMRRRVLDQAGLPACVGFAWAHWLMCDPVKQFLYPAGIYYAAQYVDEWEGQDYDGTSCRGGAKVLRNFGLIGEFRLCLDAEDIAAIVLEQGPVCVGTTWYAGMSDPFHGTIAPTGRLQGGHAYLIVGANQRHEAFTVLNSWGAGWGETGIRSGSSAGRPEIGVGDN